jgi:regulator of protease activity HflC (stomatin/prohibitin superfamily)
MNSFIKANLGLVSSIVGFLLIVGFFTLNPIFVVGPGQVGVTFSNVSGDTKSYSQGMHFRIPFVENVSKFDVKTQRDDIVAEGASKDLQVVKVEVVLNQHLDYTKVNELYIKVGRDYKEKVIVPAIHEVVKAAVAKFPVEQIIVEREKVKTIIDELLKGKLAEYHIIVENVNLVDIDFSPEFNKVVEEKQMEEQKIKTAQYQRMQAEENKKRTILEAEGEARKQQLLKESVSEKGIAIQWIGKWDGKLPVTMLGDKANILFTPKSREE